MFEFFSLISIAFAFVFARCEQALNVALNDVKETACCQQLLVVTDFGDWSLITDA